MPARRLILASLTAVLAGLGVAVAQETAPDSVGDRFKQNNAPQPLQLGPWQVTPTATLRGGYDDNVTTVPTDPAGSAFVLLRGRVDAVNADGPNSVSAYAEISQSWYASVSGLSHTDGQAGLSGSAQISDFVHIRGTIGVTYQADEDSASEGVIVGSTFDPYVNLARYLSVPASLGVTYDSGHWFIRADGTLTYTHAEARRTAGGLEVGQDYKNGTVSDLSLRAGWHVSSATALFIEGSYDLQRFKDQTADSQGWRIVGGAEFELTRLLIGDIFAGYAAQSYREGDEASGLTYGASLNWFATPLLSLHLQARRDFTAQRTIVLNNQGITEPVTRDSVTLKAEYEPLRQFLLSARLGWNGAHYQQEDRTDTGWDAGLGLEYVISPAFRLNLDYDHQTTQSDIAGNSTQNVIYLGVTTGY